MRNRGIPVWVFFVLFVMLAGAINLSPLLWIFIIYMVARYAFNNQGREEERGYGRQQQQPRTRQQRPTQEANRRDWEYRRAQERKAQTKKRAPKNNPFKKSGIEKYADYDYDGAIADFKKALAIDASDIAVHFNLACAYSINEKPDESFFHLSKAVEYGFADFEKIQTHDALAYLRIQPEFEKFVKSGYKMGGMDLPKEKKSPENTDLLDQLNKLAELKEKGLLTEEEFVAQKRKLLG